VEGELPRVRGGIVTGKEERGKRGSPDSKYVLFWESRIEGGGTVFRNWRKGVKMGRARREKGGEGLGNLDAKKKSAYLRGKGGRTGNQKAR